MNVHSAAAVLRWSACVTAVNAVTLTPLLGLFVGDGRPDVLATVLVLMLAVLLMLAAVAVTAVSRRRRVAASEPFDIEQARRETHMLGLPFPEPDGSMSWAKSTAEQVHEQLHARRRAAQSVGPDPLCDNCDGAGIVVMGYARVADNGALYRMVQPCNACRK